MRGMWKAYEEKFRELYPVLPLAELAKIFPFSDKEIKSKASNTRLRKKGKLLSWAWADEQELIKLYPDTLNAEIAKKFSRSEKSVQAAAFKLKLRKTPEFMACHIQKNQFRKGMTPVNKGKKQTEYMSPEAIERTKATRFKKGQLPHNTYNEVGKITIRHDHRERGGKRYKYICIKVGVWSMLHKHLWEQANGKVPSGHCLWFKDGDPMNCTLENLEMITRKENRKRNHPALRLGDKYVARCIVGKTGDTEAVLDSPELLELKRQQLKLNREIKNHDKNANGK
ncbi:hypothetical protein BCY91_14030 [Pelobium manganitolerans]|uniref:HNH nuclease domain-containing protein n=1 Tax=Pelobium manganitolerans TaxID=1842495 RepID=A0A419SAF0_9SPHI|nr:HNH endonuclease signature motif containing protein [Pelobium manganitolerans]RKD18991.1 hypothetical protein BCY91_14030 [Pelobium manganitolerans]